MTDRDFFLHHVSGGLFKVMGAQNVFVLDGGFDRWKSNGHIVTAERTKIAPTAFVPSFHKERAVGFPQMMEIVENSSDQIADARPAGRFTGKDPEPREGMRSGHMPGACNLPALELSQDGFLLPLSELRDKFRSAGIDLDKPVVTTCGSGVTAAVITLALDSLGHTSNRLYDGSWSEWGSRGDTPVETGD